MGDVQHQNSRLALSRLLQLASPLLPVGAYSYSQGLEWAIESQDVTNLETTKTWIGDVLQIYQANFELPLLLKLYQAWQQDDVKAVADLDAQYQAGRDSAEAFAESRQMGYSLRRLLQDVGELPRDFIEKINMLDAPAFPAVYAGVCSLWGIPQQDMLHAYAWSWAENQVSAAMKTVPLGQVSGQKILLHIGQLLPGLIRYVIALPDDEISNFCPGLTIAGCRHETQYTRLFRS